MCLYSLDPNLRWHSFSYCALKPQRSLPLYRIPRGQNTKAWELIHKAEGMRLLGYDWNGYGSPAPNDLAIRLSEEVILSSGQRMTPSRIVPSAQGGVGVYFVRNRKRGDIECLNSGSMTATLCDEGQLPKVWEIRQSEIKSALQSISKFLES